MLQLLVRRTRSCHQQNGIVLRVTQLVPSLLQVPNWKYSVLDIRDVVLKCTTDEEVVQNLSSLPPSEKYAYLHRHVKREDSFTFPTTFTGGRNRSFLARWLKEHAWLCYSIKLDGLNIFFSKPLRLLGDLMLMQ